MDAVAMIAVGGAGAFSVLLGLGLWWALRRRRRREALAREASFVRVWLYGPVWSRASVPWFVLMFGCSLVAGMLSPKGPATWGGELAGGGAALTFVVGIIQAFRNIGVLEVDRKAKRLRLSVGPWERVFDLVRPIDIRESFVLPSKLFASGGAALRLQQGELSASFWVPYDLAGFKNRVSAPVSDTTPRCRAGALGSVVLEWLRAIAEAPTASRAA
jgi:hypothetical protein